MASKRNSKPHDISQGVSFEDFQRKSQEIFDTVVKPQVEAERRLSAEEKKITLTPQEKALANCHSPY